MNKERVEFYRSILLERKKFILNTIERLREISQISDKDAESHDKYSTHLADEGSETTGIEESFMLLSRELSYLNRIESALYAIERGTYGTCTMCGKDIPHARLEAVPTTDTCIECKSLKAKNIILNWQVLLYDQ